MFLEKNFRQKFFGESSPSGSGHGNDVLRYRLLPRRQRRHRCAFPFRVVGGVWVFLARPSLAFIFSGDGKGEVTGVAGNDDDEGANTSGDGIEGLGLGGLGFFFLHEKKFLYVINLHAEKSARLVRMNVDFAQGLGLNPRTWVFRFYFFSILFFPVSFEQGSVSFIVVPQPVPSIFAPSTQSAPPCHRHRSSLRLFMFAEHHHPPLLRAPLQHLHPPLRRAPSPAVRVYWIVMSSGHGHYESTAGKISILQLKCERKSNWDEVICD